MSDSDGPVDHHDEGDDDLFGDVDEDPSGSPAPQVLSDKDLDSDADRANEGEGYGSEREEDAPRHQDKVIAGIQIYRHRTPKTKNGILSSLKVPEFIKFVPEPFDPDNFEPTAWDIENARSERPKPVVRWYRDRETGELRSNANIYKWSDGSMSISVGDQHFAIQKKEMAPPPGKPYNELHDTHTYAAAAHLSSGLFMIVGHVGEEYTIRQNTTQEDDEALKRLSMRMREARAQDEASRIIKTTHDPELQRKQAEIAEKERMKAQRRRENAAARAEGGPRSGRSGGLLSVDDLEGGRRSGGRKRGTARGRGPRRGPEYDSDDDRPEGSRRQDDYDMGDDFIAPSDDDEEEGDEEEEDILDDDDEEDEAPRSKRRKTADVSDEDADGEDDDFPAEHSNSRRRRKIVDDDED